MAQDPNQPQNPQITQPVQPGVTDPRTRQNRGTGFTNISNILGANQGAGQREGQAIGSGISKQADSVREGIQAGQANFNQGMQAGSASANQNIQAGKNLTQQTGESADQYANRIGTGTGTDYTAIGKNLQSAAYNGPTALANQGQLQSQAATASALGRLAGSAGGQSQLLQNMVAQRGNYSTGQNALDSLLVGREGQGAIQQGRQAVTGISNQVNDVTGNAAAQAAATKAAIDTNRTATTQALQNQLTGAGDDTSNGVTGFTTLAKNQATDFQNNATRIQQLLSGAVTPDKVTDADKALISHLGDYGIQDYNLYTKANDDQLKSGLGQLAGSLSNSFGSARYTDPQKQAAMNLADVLGQSDVKKTIGDNTFNTNVFNGANESDYFKPSDTSRATDEANRDKLTSFGNDLKAYQNYIGSNANNRTYTTNPFGPQDPNGAANPNADVSTFTNDPVYQSVLAKYMAQVNPQNAAFQQANGGVMTPELAKQTAIREVLNDRYGDAANGHVDAGDQWSKLGLQNQSGVETRDAQAVLDAAGKQVGQDTSIQNFVLQKLLGQQMTDPSGVKQPLVQK